MLEQAPWAFGSSPEDDRGLDRAHVHAMLFEPEHAILGMFIDGRLVSVAGVRREPKLKARHLAGIFGVYTSPEARRAGAARAVVSRAIEIARSWKGVDWVQLGVSQRSPDALHLYESLGFQAWGTEPDATRIDGIGHAEIHMRLRL
jgi:ribosomal protein S18 acetylase RimI-like enzyme